MLRVAGWDEHFENNRTRELKRLHWLPVPNKQDGDGYTDGIDQFFVTQTFGVSDLFASLPARKKPSRSHTIARYRDPAMSVLLFWDDGVSFQVAGRGSLLRLDDFAQAIYTKAIYNR